MIRRPISTETMRQLYPPPTPEGGPAVDSLGRKWIALHTAAVAIAALAGDAANDLADVDGVLARLALMPAAGRRRIDDHFSDLIAVMEPGLAALLSIRRRHGDASASARALLREFRRARAMIELMLG